MSGEREYNRREILGMSSALAAGLAGCNEEGSSSGSEETDSPTRTDTRRPTASQTPTDTATATSTRTESETPTDTPTATATPEPSPLSKVEDETDLEVAFSLVPKAERFTGAFRASDAEMQQEASEECGIEDQAFQFGPEDADLFNYTDLTAGSYDQDIITWIYDPNNLSRANLRDQLIEERDWELLDDETEFDVDYLEGEDHLREKNEDNDAEAAMAIYDFFAAYSSKNLSTAENPLEHVEESIWSRANDNSVVDGGGYLHEWFQDEDCFINKENPLGAQQGVSRSYSWADWYEIGSIDEGFEPNNIATAAFDDNLEELTMWHPTITEEGIQEQEQVDQKHYVEDNLQNSSPWYNAREPWPDSEVEEWSHCG